MFYGENLLEVQVVGSFRPMLASFYLVYPLLFYIHHHVAIQFQPLPALMNLLRLVTPKGTEEKQHIRQHCCIWKVVWAAGKRLKQWVLWEIVRVWEEVSKLQCFTVHLFPEEWLHLQSRWQHY